MYKNAVEINYAMLLVIETVHSWFVYLNKLNNEWMNDTQQ